ncbi:MAG: HNH endonuclease [Anaerolineales bacterium]|jgi:hypothetical protein|uniref:HNH endonuclease n=1 Tax=Candidatus Villigracilis vicinus TaxID=3140679 RepID=UPI003134CA20|nr:HNH endonuclease [Anaerolineales bacterium]MBK7449108.1 HNH endonuclease [Anaerolineales bacterium]MBK9781235.1 HNH endonuclease [Anaerolineales bacterium]
MPTQQDFQTQLDSIFKVAKEKHLSAIVLKAGDLHRLVGGYPGADPRMGLCCVVMRENMIGGDEVLSEPPKGVGATLTIMYQFPRPK